MSLPSPHPDERLWREIVVRLSGELATLPAAEREWIRSRLARIAALQEQLARFFLLADGPEKCRECQGECCARGRHHLTLVNLLGYLLAGEIPPSPDFASTCPFLGEAGCSLPAARRPFNCITFHCEAVEEALSTAERAAFYAGERELRELYLAFDHRYAGASLRGLLQRAESLGDGALLANIEERR